MGESATTERCGAGIRGVAMGIDAVVWFVLFIISGLLVGAITGDLQTSGSSMNADLAGTGALASFILWLGLSIGYHVVLEWWSGKTVGKALVKIEATDADGSSLSLQSSIVRNVLRLIDFLPFFYLVGIGSLLISDQSQRIGDRLANTTVVRS